MAKKKLGISIALVIGFCLFTGLLQFVPISISFGKHHDADLDLRNVSLQPNCMYHVYVKKPMTLPDNMELAPKPLTQRGAGFFHDSKREDGDKGKCMGTIKILLQDDGRKKYKCLRCGKEIWDRIPNGK